METFTPITYVGINLTNSNRCGLGFFMPRRLDKRVCASHVDTILFCNRSEDSHEYVTGEEPRGSGTSAVQMLRRIPFYVLQVVNLASSESSVLFHLCFLVILMTRCISPNVAAQCHRDQFGLTQLWVTLISKRRDVTKPPGASSRRHAYGSRIS